MQKSIGVTELQRKLGTVLDEVAEDHVPYVLTRSRQPRAALVPYEDFLRYRRLEESSVLQRFERMKERMARASAQYTEDEVEAEIEAARAELDP